MPRRLISPLALLVLIAPGAGAQESLRPVPVGAEVSWEGPQVVEADGKGRVYVLRARELEVFPVVGEEGLGEPRRLFDSGMDGGPPVTRGAMEDEDEWIVRQGYEVRWFRDGEEKPVPRLRWPAWSITMLKGTPVAAVVPAPMGPAPPGESDARPILVALSGDRWSPLVEADEEEAGLPRHELMQRHAARLATDSRGTIWMGQEYAYKVRRFSGTGRELLRLTVDGGEIHHRDASGPDEVRERLEGERKNMGNGDRGQVIRNTAVPVIAALAEGRDGNQYVLVHHPGEEGAAPGVVLDRWDPARGVLERVSLAMEDPGGMSMTAGKAGLYVAAFSGERGRWLIPWEDLRQAAWTTVEGVEVDGLEPLPGEESEEGEQVEAGPPEGPGGEPAGGLPKSRG